MRSQWLQRQNLVSWKSTKASHPCRQSQNFTLKSRALSSRIYFRICDRPSAFLVSPPKLPRSWLKFTASPALRFLNSTVKSSWEHGSNWLALEGNENLLSGYSACHLNALDDISTPGNASSPPQSSGVVWSFFPFHMGTEVSNNIDPSAHFSILCTSLFEHISANRKASMCNSFLAACRTEPLMWLFDYIWSKSHDQWMMSQLSLWS